MEELIAKRYVQALLAVSDKEEIETYIKLLNGIADSFSSAEVQEMIEAPIVSRDEKVDAVLSALGKKRDEKIVNFIKILGEKKRLDLIPEIAAIFNAQIQKESNSYDGIVNSKETLEKDEIDKLEKTLKRYTGSKITLTQEKSDLDGLKVAVEDLGIEVNFSKERVKEQLIDFIMKSQ